MKTVFKLIIGFIGIIICTYLLLSNITVNNDQPLIKDEIIYLIDKNGIHVDIVIPDSVKYVSYGWGSEIFYKNVPTWDDVTFKIAFEALFTKPNSVMNVTHYYNKHDDHWIPVKVSKKQLNKLKININKEFKNRSLHEGLNEAKSNYNIFHTCNTWANKVLKNSGIKTCMWTPFSKDIIKIKRNEK